MDILELFCSVDDFCQSFESGWKRQLVESSGRKRNRDGALCLSEVMTIIIRFHESNFRTFKHYYKDLLHGYQHCFPNLVSYNRFVELMPGALVPLSAYLMTRMGSVTGISFIDSTSIAVCKPKRISRNKVFQGIAKIGKSSMGWFYGFKLHLIVNEIGELLGLAITTGNVDDRVPVHKMAKNLFGKLFGDKGYISKKLFSELFEKGIHLITHQRDNMKNILIPIQDKILLRKRSIIETINDQLKNISQIEHSRHRSPNNFLVNLLAGIIAYTHQHKKPKISGLTTSKGLLS